jgi:hypothetical protein
MRSHPIFLQTDLKPIFHGPGTCNLLLMPNSIALDARQYQGVGRDRRRHVNASRWLGVAEGPRGEEGKHDPFAGIIQIKFDRIISERSSLASSKPPSLQAREPKVDGSRTKG